MIMRNSALEMFWEGGGEGGGMWVLDSLLGGWLKSQVASLI